MSETLVHCARCERDAPAVSSRLTFSGELAERIRAGVCQSCWREWLEMQIKVINEYRLHMGEPEHRKALNKFAEQFFRFDGGDGSLGAGPQGGLS